MSQEPREYRVTWHRSRWKATTSPKSRTFARRPDAVRFVDKLRGHERLDVFDVLRVDSRPVGRWQAEPLRPR
jgi:hypothetical protein